MGTARCKRSGPSFYLRKHTFDCVSIPVFNHLESIAIVTEGITQRLRIINEELDWINLVSLVQIGQRINRRY